MSNDNLGTYRIVGEKKVPDHHIYPMESEEQRSDYFRRLSAMQTRAAAIVPIARVMAPSEPRVKRFRTLEEANDDQTQGMLRTMEFLNKARTYVNSK